MFWADRTNRIAGILLLLLAATVIVSLIAGFSIGDSDPFERDEIDDVLVDIKDNEALYGLQTGANFLTDAALGILAAGALYVVFRKRHRLLSVLGLVQIIAASAAFMAADAASVPMLALAQDFADGGPEGIAAGDAYILQVARAVGIFQGVAEYIAFTALDLGVLAFSVLIAWAPAGAVNPPRWIGWVGAVAALGAILSWLVIATDAAFVFFIVAGIGTLIWLIVLGGWLLLRAPEEGAATPARAAA